MTEVYNRNISFLPFDIPKLKQVIPPDNLYLSCEPADLIMLVNKTTAGFEAGHASVD